MTTFKELTENCVWNWKVSDILANIFSFFVHKNHFNIAVFVIFSVCSYTHVSNICRICHFWGRFKAEIIDFFLKFLLNSINNQAGYKKK